MKKRLLGFVWLHFYLTALLAQSGGLQFRLQMGNEPLRLLQPYPLHSTGDSVSLETCRFYVSGIQGLQNGIPVWTEPESYHLLDAASPESLKIPLNLPASTPIQQIRFLLGIDSLTNASGVKGKDLDPLNGMYWAWQSGYIHVKVEGHFISGAKKTPFQYHLGGFLSGLLATAEIYLQPLKPGSIPVKLDVLPWMIRMKDSGTFKIMSPSREAVRSVSELAAQMISSNTSH